MRKLGMYAAHLAAQLSAAWRHRKFYPNARQRYRALSLRLTSIRSLRSLASGRTEELWLKGQSRPVYVRSATSDFWVLEEIFEKRDYAVIETWGLRQGANILDLGANIGLASRYFSSVIPDCRVVAVEPDASNCAMVADNCRELIEQRRMKIVTAFVAAQAGSAIIDRSQDSWGFAKGAGDSSAGAAAGGERIPCVTVESLIGEFEDGGRVDLLKCDVEGTERELFAACGAWVGRVHHLIVETHLPYDLAQLYGDLRRGGWNFEIVEERVGEGSSLAMLRQVATPTSERPTSA